MDQADHADVIDQVAGLSPTREVGALRRQRPEILRLSQTSFRAALLPADSGNLNHSERAALACRIARLLKDESLAAHYAELPDSEEDRAAAVIADPGVTSGAETRITAILRHVDLLTLSPEDATRSDIEKLMSAGLTDRDIVTLTGLIAFVNYQARVVAGLRMMKGE